MAAVDWPAVSVEALAPQTLLDLMKLYMGIDSGDASQDEALGRALNMAGPICEKYVDRLISKRSFKEYFQSHFGTVTLHNYPVDAGEPIDVTLDGTTDSSYSVFYSQWGLPQLTRQSQQADMPLDWRSFAQVIVTYTAGWDPLPADLAQAIVYVAGDLSASEGTSSPPGGGGSGEIKSMSIHDVGSITYDVGTTSGRGGEISSFGLINDTATHLLSRYKRLVA